jgi:lipopolysaccharide transport system ATP-binding protein
MENDIVIRAEHISKKFCKSLKYVMTYGAVDITKDFLNIKSRTETLRKGEFWAVDEVTFGLNRGQTIGIIGPNGSGKSTILKMLNGIYMPDKGKIQIKGRVGALIEVGAGFHPMLTGRENIYINGSILGMSKKEIDKKFDEIVDFADIGDFIDSPVKHYSSGMYVRLGFSIAVHCEPEILLVDEVLAVGDSRFYNKCTQKINQMTANNTSIVLVSHNMWLIKTMCDWVLLLGQGKIVKAGNPSECIYAYSKLGSIDHLRTARSIGSEPPVVISLVEIMDEHNKPVNEVTPDARVNVSIKYSCLKEKFRGILLLRVTTHDGFPLYTSYSNTIDFHKGDGLAAASICSISLLEGEYRLWIAVCGEQKENEIYHDQNISVNVRQTSSYPDSRFGFFINEVTWNLNNTEL